MDQPSKKYLVIHGDKPMRYTRGVRQEAEKWSMEFHLPDAISNDIPQGQWRKILTAMLSHHYQDADIVPTLNEWFAYLIAREKHLCSEASKRLINEYRGTDSIADKKERKEVREHNSSLKSTVRYYKAGYEKYLKRIEIFKELKAQQGINV